jgi:hypothetical protein
MLLEQLDSKFDDMSSQIVDRSAFARLATLSLAPFLVTDITCTHSGANVAARGCARGFDPGYH